MTTLKYKSFSSFPKYKRNVAYIRDDYTCQYCKCAVLPGTSGLINSATLDHVKCQVNGGLDTLKNLTTSCLSCNSIKGDRNFVDFAKLLSAKKGTEFTSEGLYKAARNSTRRSVQKHIATAKAALKSA